MISDMDFPLEFEIYHHKMVLLDMGYLRKFRTLQKKKSYLVKSTYNIVATGIKMLHTKTYNIEIYLGNNKIYYIYLIITYI